MSYKGRYSPKNVAKYKGDPTKIVYRSLWERKYMKWLDLDERCIWWASEEGFVPYISPIDNKRHRYFPDFLVMLKTKTGDQIFMVEVKPKRRLLPPVKKTRVTRRFIRETKEYHVNQAKFEAATKLCAERGWKFQILTEDDLGIKG